MPSLNRILGGRCGPLRAIAALILAAFLLTGAGCPPKTPKPGEPGRRSHEANYLTAAALTVLTAANPLLIVFEPAIGAAIDTAFEWIGSAWRSLTSKSPALQKVNAIREEIQAGVEAVSRLPSEILTATGTLPKRDVSSFPARPIRVIAPAKARTATRRAPFRQSK